MQARKLALYEVMVWWALLRLFQGAVYISYFNVPLKSAFMLSRLT
jgi:hypothetical protein